MANALYDPLDVILEVARRVRATPGDGLELRTRITSHQLERLLGLGIQEYTYDVLGEKTGQAGWVRDAVWARSKPNGTEAPITAEEAYKAAQTAMVEIQARLVDSAREPIRQCDLSRRLFGDRDCDAKGHQKYRVAYAFVEAMQVFGLVRAWSVKGRGKWIQADGPSGPSSDSGEQAPGFDAIVVPFAPAWREDKKVCWTVEERVRAVFENKYGRLFPKVRPEFLGVTGADGRRRRLELDGYCAELRLAFEYQGLQHYAYVPHFHRNGPVDLESQQRRDALKVDLCAQAGVRLVVVPTHVNTETRIRAFIAALGP